MADAAAIVDERRVGELIEDHVQRHLCHFAEILRNGRNAVPRGERRIVKPRYRQIFRQKGRFFCGCVESRCGTGAATGAPLLFGQIPPFFAL